MEIVNDFMQFVDKTPNAYYCVENLRKILIESGFQELYENESWNDLENDGKYFVVRNDSSLIAFKMSDIKENIGFNIVSVHADSPSFIVKPNANIFENEYLKLNTSGYGAMINYSWLDRPLSLAGRVITKHDGVYEKKLINIDKDLLIIPSQAFHINRDVNNKNELNHQIDMLPIMALSNERKLEDIIRENIETQGNHIDQICDYDLYLYNRDMAKKAGLNDEFILSPRLDDLASLFPGVYGFINSSNNNSINVFCAFNNEEIGNLTQQGADSTFLRDILNRIANATQIDLFVALNNSMAVSADNAHAIHPNASSKSDPTNKVKLNNGVVIKHHIKYTTDALTSSLIKAVCNYADVPYQDFACRSDMACGGTLGLVSQGHIGVDSVDIGIPQLAMHSANETIGAHDMVYMYKMFLEFYNTTFKKEKNTIRALRK